MFADWKQKLAIKKQYLTQKFSKNKRPNVNEEYQQLADTVDIYKHYLKNLPKYATECLEPGTHLRIRPAAASNGTHNAPARVSYPHAEMRLSEHFAEYAKKFDLDSQLGGTLSCVSDGYARLAEAKNRASDDAQSRFTLPVTDIYDKALKDILNLHKKADYARVALELEQNRVFKGSITVNDPKYVEAEEKYQAAYEESYEAMTEFLGLQAEHIELINNLISAHLGYIQDAQRVLMDMQSSVQAKLKEAEANPTLHIPKSVGKFAGNRSDVSLHREGKPGVGDGGFSPNPSDASFHVEMKPAHSDQLNRVPECRALYDFEADNPSELSFKTGDRIQLLEQLDENWFSGRKGDKTGYFPINYVQVLVPLH